MMTQLQRKRRDDRKMSIVSTSGIRTTEKEKTSREGRRVSQIEATYGV
jgi:hypothetical protein